jgi:hypothetical protein
MSEIEWMTVVPLAPTCPFYKLGQAELKAGVQGRGLMYRVDGRCGEVKCDDLYFRLWPLPCLSALLQPCFSFQCIKAEVWGLFESGYIVHKPSMEAQTLGQKSKPRASLFGNINKLMRDV